MKWQGHRQSDNVEDRRGQGGGLGGGGVRMGGRGIGLGTVAIALLASWIFGINPMTILGMAGGGGPVAMSPTQQSAPARRPPAQDEVAAFVSTVLASTEDTWLTVFQANGKAYRKPTLVLYEGGTRTACGTGQAAMGPFYCPGDEKVYVDLSFFNTLRQRMGAPGDFAQAYVVAHEVGHHVQHVLGILERVDSQRKRVSEVQANALSVRLELQADCLAGVWGHHSQQGKKWLEAGDIEEGLNAASQIGDDNLQRKGQGMVVPESFTHGSSAQRVSWFKRGLASGRIGDCNTFDTRAL